MPSRCSNSPPNILDIVKAFRTAYVLHVVEHTREVGLSPREDWEADAHLLPLLA